jgi:hypothetical protein
MEVVVTQGNGTGLVQCPCQDRSKKEVFISFYRGLYQKITAPELDLEGQVKFSR